ncbi:hypothetical protein BJY04DRAFT_214330 [Aspergillus karnatakaensis]|uniref:uncharacterized protein n=1 Tax=Aspergillus karnatakaensis TaxID=1810916 RepID=UPI003CCD3DDB
MARAAVIPQSPPKPTKRATRGRAKGSTSAKTSRAGAKTPKGTAAEAKKKNARAAVTQSSPSEEWESEEDTEDEIGVIEHKSRGKTAASAPKTKSATGRGRKPAAAAVNNDSESENDDDELAPSDAPKKRAGRPKAGTTKAAAGRPRGRPKASAAKTASDEDILKENTRRNARLQDSDDFSSSQQGPTEIFISTGSSLLRGPAKKKKVTFQELVDSDEEDDIGQEPAPTTRRRRGTVVAKVQEGMGAKPVRKAPAASTRGRKPAAAKKGGAKPLSPKKDRQVAKGLSAYASSDGEDDELNCEKDDIKLVVHSPQKRGNGMSGFGSPVRRINFTPNKASKAFDENGEPALPPPKSFDFGDSLYMSSPARRPPPSPFHFTLKETPKRGGLSFNDSIKPLARPESTPTQNSPLRASARKANLGTPARGSLFGREGDKISQPNFTPGHNSPLKTSPKKGIFGASFMSQQPAEQASTPFKTNLLMSPAKKVSTPFKSSLTRVPSSLSKETRQAVDTESDDETVSMYDESPLRAHNSENAMDFENDEPSEEADARLTPEDSPARAVEYAEEEEEAQSDHSTESSGQDHEHELSEDDEEDEVSPFDVDYLAKDLAHTMQEAEDLARQADAEVEEIDFEPAAEYDLEEEESTTPQDDIEEPEHKQGQEEVHDEDSDMEGARDEGLPSFRHSFLDGFEDVFTESSPIRDAQAGDTTVAYLDVDNESAVSEEEDLANEDNVTTHAGLNDEPTLVGQPGDDMTDTGPIQPYEIDEAEDTPFMNFLLTHWAPSLPCVDDCEPTTPSVEETQDSAELLEEHQGDTLDNSTSPESPEQAIQADEEEPQQPSQPSRGPRFTLLAEQLSQWKASSPAKEETGRPRRRGVFSLSGRSSDVSSITPRAPKTDIFANAPTFSTKPRAHMEIPTTPAPEIHEDTEDMLAENIAEPDFRGSTRRPMTGLGDEEITDAPQPLEEAAQNDEVEKEHFGRATYPTLESPEDEKENGTSLPLPATPAKNPALQTQTYHTVSKVPLKPEGQISPLKISRKRGRSLSITSPVRSSPRLRDFTLPAAVRRIADSPHRKSPRLSYGSARKSPAKQVLKKAVEAQQPQRARTPLRSASPSKTPRKQVAAYSQCLSGAVVYVDVHTTEGEDASGIFIEVLQQMGAKCIRNWSWNPRVSVSPEESAAAVNNRIGITHVVFKDGGVRTLEKVRQAAGVVKCVGVGWVLDCERKNEWLDEAPYAVDSSIIPRGGAKRRKSMEPRALSNVNGTLVKSGVAGPSSNRRPSAAAGNPIRSTTPLPDDRSSPEGTPKYGPGHTEGDQKYWQTPRTPSAASLGYNLDSIGISPATPFYLSQRSKLVQQTCPPKQTQQGLFSKTASVDAPSRQLKARLEAARRKSLAFKPSIGSPLLE